jgi:ubiquitin C-terminal hydrolase
MRGRKKRVTKSHHWFPIDDQLQLGALPFVEQSLSTSFNLHGIIAHSGEAHEGHYIYLSRHYPNEWIVYDDSYVTATDSIAGFIGQEGRYAAYILLYAQNKPEVP